MRKLSVISLIIFLILITAFIKNSTKRIDEDIFTKKENIRELKKEFEKIKLEYEYLSSPENLLKYNELYFDEKLVKKKLQEIIILDKSSDLIKMELNEK